MKECLGDYNMKIGIIYLDNIIIFANHFEENLERLYLVLTRLKECNLKLSTERCFVMQKSVHFLGHVLRAWGAKTDPDKIEKVKNRQVSKNADELCIACAGYIEYMFRTIPSLQNGLQICYPLPQQRRKIKDNTEIMEGQRHGNVVECLISNPGT